MVTLLAAAVVAASLPAYAAGQDGPSAKTFLGQLGVIAFTSGDPFNLDIYRIDIDGFGATNLTDGVPGSHSQPSWSAEGTRIAFVSDRDDFDSEVYVMTATGRRQTRLTTNPGLDTEPSWFPSDDRIAFRRGSGQFPAEQADIYTLALDADAEPAGDPVQLTTSEANDIMPAVSPDGKRIAFASNRDGDYEIYVMKAKPEGPKNKPVKLTNNTDVVDWNPDWSPNGKRIVFESNRDGDDEIFVMNADGSKEKNLTRNEVIDVDPTWSPDGKRIAFERNLGGVSRDIFRMRADGTKQFNLTDSSAIDANPAWQPR
jgi:Tol biopolymer transport system component